MPDQSLPRLSDEAVAEAMSELEANRETICEHAGHEWEDMGGGMQICVVCTEERDGPDAF